MSADYDPNSRTQEEITPTRVKTQNRKLIRRLGMS